MTAAYWITGETRAVVDQLPAGSIDTVLTSPPFWRLRSYLQADHPDKADEIGSEPAPGEFVATMLDLTSRLRRVLAPHGSICVELGDTFCGSGGPGGDYDDGGLRDGQPKFRGSATAANGCPDAKSLALIPEAYRLALAYGLNPLTGEPSPAGRWKVRNVVRWVRPNPPVGALGDKLRPATSDMVVACTSGKRWFDLDAVRTPLSAKTLGNLAAPDSRARTTARGGETDNGVKPDSIPYGANAAGAPPLDWQYVVEAVVATMLAEAASPKDIARRVAELGGTSDAWEISPGGYSGSHYAVFPPELCVRPIEAMCPRRVCLTCGTPSQRQAEPSYTINRAGGTSGVRRDLRNPDGHDKGMAGQPTMTAHPITTGWSSCGCAGTDGIRLDGFHTGTGWRPGRVLDPFGGSGTTMSVSNGHGRDSVGIDIDARNAHLARERVGMFLEEITAGELSRRWSCASPQTLDGARANA